MTAVKKVMSTCRFSQSNFNCQLALKNPGPAVIKLFPCSIHLSTKSILLINVKMLKVVGILTFISMINTTSEGLKAKNYFICRYFSFIEQLKVRAKLSCGILGRVWYLIVLTPDLCTLTYFEHEKSFITSGLVSTCPGLDLAHHCKTSRSVTTSES